MGLLAVLGLRLPAWWGLPDGGDAPQADVHHLAADLGADAGAHAQPAVDGGPQADVQVEADDARFAAARAAIEPLVAQADQWSSAHADRLPAGLAAGLSDAVLDIEEFVAEAAWGDALVELPRLQAAAHAVLAARDAYEEFSAAFAPIEADVDEARRRVNGTQPTSLVGSMLQTALATLDRERGAGDRFSATVTLELMRDDVRAVLDEPLGAVVPIAVPSAVPSQAPLNDYERALRQGIDTMAQRLAESRTLQGLAAKVAANAQAVSTGGEIDREQRLLALHDEMQALLNLMVLHAEISVTCDAITALVPQRKPELAQTRSAACALVDAGEAGARLAGLTAELERLRSDGAPRAKVALARVAEASPEVLKALPPAERLEWLGDLRHGNEADLPARHAAMAAIFEQTELDARFEALDAPRRQRVLDKLRQDPALQKASREWQDMTPVGRMKALEQALALQCAELGLARVPPVKRFSDPAAQVTEESKTTCAGYFQPATGEIYINDLSDAFKLDFEAMLDTVIHENTHHHQHELVAALDAGRLPESDPQYQQALLFQLNFGKPGYIPSGTGYPEQPTERHAWKAGGEVRQLFLADLRVEARLAIDEMAQWAATRPTEDRTQVETWTKDIDTAIADGQTSAAGKRLGRARREFVRLVAARQRQVVAQELCDRLQAWPAPHQAARDNVDWALGQIRSLWSSEKLTDKLESIERLFAGWQQQAAQLAARDAAAVADEPQ